MIPPRSRFTGKTLSTRKARYEQAIPSDEAEEMPRHVDPTDAPVDHRNKHVTLYHAPKIYGGNTLTYRPESGLHLGKRLIRAKRR
jgi:hypothetical protein